MLKFHAEEKQKIRIGVMFIDYVGINKTNILSSERNVNFYKANNVGNNYLAECAKSPEV